MTDLALWFQIYGIMIQTIQTIALLITLGVIILYTIFTYGLKKTTVKQTELSLRPCIIFTWDSGFRFKNTGLSPALNIKIDDFEIDEYEFIFYRLDSLMPNETKKIMMHIKKKAGEVSKMRKYLHFIFDTTKQKEIPLIIHYENLENERYFSRLKIYAGLDKPKLLETKKIR